ncbi:MAG: hypothetical protein DRP73_04200, partial [Candidatus Omnitrophota bacterium]
NAEIAEVERLLEELDGEVSPGEEESENAEIETIRASFADYRARLEGFLQDIDDNRPLTQLTADYLKAKLDLLKFRVDIGTQTLGKYLKIFLYSPQELNREDKIRIIDDFYSLVPQEIPVDELGYYITLESTVKKLAELERDGGEILPLDVVKDDAGEIATALWGLLNYLHSSWSAENNELIYPIDVLADFFLTVALQVERYEEGRDYLNARFLELNGPALLTEFLTKVEDWLISQNMVLSEEFLKLEIEKRSESFSWDSFGEGELNKMYVTLRYYFVEKFNSYNGAINRMVGEFDSFKSIFEDFNVQISALSEGRAEYSAGELSVGVGELADVSSEILSLTSFLSGVLALDVSVEDVLSREGDSLGGFWIDAINFFAHIFGQEGIETTREVKTEIRNLLESFRSNINDIFSSDVIDIGSNLGQVNPYVEEFEELIPRLNEALRREKLASFAFSQAVQFALLSVGAGLLGQVIRSTSLYTSLAQWFKGLGTAGKIAKWSYVIGKYIIGGAIAVLNQIDAHGQELVLSVLGKPGAWLASMLFPGSPLAAMAFRIGINSLVVGLSSGFAEGLKGTPGGDIAGIIRNPLSIFNKIGGGKISWINNIIEPGGVPLPDIAEFFHLIFFGHDAWPYRMGTTTIDFSSDIQPVVTTTLTEMPDWVETWTRALIPVPEIDTTETLSSPEDVSADAEAPAPAAEQAPEEEPARETTVDSASDPIAETVTTTLDNLPVVSRTRVTPLTDLTPDQIEEAVDNIIDDPNNEGLREKLEEIREEMISTIKAVQRRLKGEILGIEEGGDTNIIEKANFWADVYLEIERCTGKTPHIYQLLAAYLIVEHGYDITGFDENMIGGPMLMLNIYTGQGKTLTGEATAHALLTSGKVDTVLILNAQDQLAERDFGDTVDDYVKAGYDRSKIAFIDAESKFKVTIDEDGDGLADRDEQGNLKLREISVENLTELRIIYAEATKVGFFLLRQIMEGDYSGWDSSERVGIILDECDSILVEKMLSPLIISESTGEYCSGNERRFWKEVGKLARGEYCNIDEFLGRFRSRGETIADKIYSIIPSSIKERYPPNAIAALIYAISNARNIYGSQVGNYIIVEKDGRRQIIIVSQFSHEPQLGQHWSNWIHQIIEAAEGLEVSRKSSTLRILTIKEVLSRFGFVVGFSGTANIFSDLVSTVYGGQTVTIPRSWDVERNDFVFYCSNSEYEEKMLESALEAAKKGHPVVLVTDLKKLDDFYSMLMSGLEEEGISEVTL